MSASEQTRREERFGIRSGEASTTFTVNGDGTYTLSRFTPPTINGWPSTRPYRPQPGEPPLLSSTVNSLREAEEVLVDWTGLATIDPDRPL
jgi:hypothetical protein